MPGLGVVIPTKAGGRVEKSGCEGTLRQIRGQMPRLRCAPLGMTNSAGFLQTKVTSNGGALWSDIIPFRARASIPRTAA